MLSSETGPVKASEDVTKTENVEVAQENWNNANAEEVDKKTGGSPKKKADGWWQKLVDKYIGKENGCSWTKSQCFPRDDTLGEPSLNDPDTIPEKLYAHLFFGSNLLWHWGQGWKGIVRLDGVLVTENKSHEWNDELQKYAKPSVDKIVHILVFEEDFVIGEYVFSEFLGNMPTFFQKTDQSVIWWGVEPPGKDYPRGYFSHTCLPVLKGNLENINKAGLTWPGQHVSDYAKFKEEFKKSTLRGSLHKFYTVKEEHVKILKSHVQNAIDTMEYVRFSMSLGAAVEEDLKWRSYTHAGEGCIIVSHMSENEDKNLALRDFIKNCMPLDGIVYQVLDTRPCFLINGDSAALKLKENTHIYESSA